MQRNRKKTSNKGRRRENSRPRGRQKSSRPRGHQEDPRQRGRQEYPAAEIHRDPRVQRRHRKKSGRGHAFTSILLLVLIFLLARWIYLYFFTAHFDQIPALRGQANTSLEEDLLVGKTNNRGLTVAEKREDVARVQEMIETLRGNSNSHDPVIDEKNEAQQEVIHSSSDGDFVRKLQKYIQEQELPIHLVGTVEYSHLQANLGNGFFEKNSPFALAVDNSRVKDRYDRMGAESFKYSAPTITMNAGQKYAILSNLDFSDGALPVAEKRIQEFFQTGRPDWRLIIDLRHTGGESAAFWTQGLLPCLANGTYSGQAAVYMMKGREHEKETDSLNSDLDSYADYLSVRESLPAFQLDEGRNKIRESGPDQMLDKYDYRKKLQIKSSNLSTNISSKAVYLLIDNTTTGQAATFADFCQSNELARICGQTSGPGAWNLPAFLLPLRHSGLLISGRFNQAMRMDIQGVMPISVRADLPLEGADLLSALILTLR